MFALYYAKEGINVGFTTKVRKMSIFFEIAKGTALFSGLEEEEIEHMLNCFYEKKKKIGKNEFIYRAGEGTPVAGMVISGSVLVIKEDFWGNQNIIVKIGEGQIFGETYGCLPTQPMDVSILTAEPTEILLLDIGKILKTCPVPCPFHEKLINNLLEDMARKNIVHTRKIEFLSQRTTREKLLSYLSAESIAKNNSKFTIQFNRQQLADYLAVDRSAMSNELSKLKDDGIISFHKNFFELKEKQ